MLERLIHDPLAREIGQPPLTLSSLNKIDLIWFKKGLRRCLLMYRIVIKRGIGLSLSQFQKY